MSNIKYFGFAKASSSAPIFGNNLLPGSADDIKLQVIKVLTRLKDFELRPDERQKMKSELGCWYCKKDNRGVLYFALCSPNYPQRHIYAAINQLKDHLSKLGDYQTEPDSTLKLHSRQFVEQLCKDFQNLKGFDKITVIGGHLDQVVNDMRKNTSQIAQNMFNAQKLQQKSDHLKEKAFMFESTAEDVKHNLSRRACKIRVIIGISALSLILLIILPIVTNTIV